MAIKIMLNECMNHLGVGYCRMSLVVPFCRTAIGNSEECGKKNKNLHLVSSQKSIKPKRQRKHQNHKNALFLRKELMDLKKTKGKRW